MPLSILPKPQFPTVPDVSGVPVLKRITTGAKVIRAVLTGQQSEIWQALTTQGRWGIFDQNGQAVMLADSVLDMGYNSGSQISQYPIAEGAFANYNKVINPAEIKIRLIKGSGLTTTGELLNVFKNGIGNLGNSAVNARSDFLDTLHNLKSSLMLINVVTPEKSYINYNITEYSYRREQTKGAHAIIVDLSLTEVREVKPQYYRQAEETTVQTDHAKQPDAKPAQNNGKVRGRKVTYPTVLEKIQSA